MCMQKVLPFLSVSRPAHVRPTTPLVPVYDCAEKEMHVRSLTPVCTGCQCIVMDAAAWKAHNPVGIQQGRPGGTAAMMMIDDTRLVNCNALNACTMVISVVTTATIHPVWFEPGTWRARPTEDKAWLLRLPVRRRSHGGGVAFGAATAAGGCIVRADDDAGARVVVRHACVICAP